MCVEEKAKWMKHDFIFYITYIQHYVQFDFYKYNTFSSSTLLSKITQGDKKYTVLDRIS